MAGGRETTVVCVCIQIHTCTHVQTQNVTHGGQQATHESAVCPGSDASKPTARWAVSAGAQPA